MSHHAGFALITDHDGTGARDAGMPSLRIMIKKALVKRSKALIVGAMMYLL